MTKTKIISKIFWFILLFLILIMPVIATLAQTNTPEKIKLEAPITETSVPKIIGNIIKTLLTIVGALALGMFVYGGFTWLTSGGSPERVKKGRDILVWAIIGLTFIFASYTLVDFLLRAFGL